MEHPNIAFIQRFYELFARGEMHTTTSMFSEDFLFMPAGKYGQLAGPRRGPQALLSFTEQQMELTGGTWIPRPYDILASDAHVAVLVDVQATRGERTVQFRLVHVWHFKGGVATGLHSYVDDQYLYDEFFA
jgi:ketosteroid isomerase-like protein